MIIVIKKFLELYKFYYKKVSYTYFLYSLKYRKTFQMIYLFCSPNELIGTRNVRKSEQKE